MGDSCWYNFERPPKKWTIRREAWLKGKFEILESRKSSEMYQRFNFYRRG